MSVPTEGWDATQALTSLGGDSEYLNELAGIFCAACPTLLRDIGHSLICEDYLTTEDSAHLLWASARTLSATEFANAAHGVEMLARRKEFDDLESAYVALQKEAARLLRALADFRSQRPGLPGGPKRKV